MFTSIVFNDRNLWICQYIFKDNYQLFISTNQFYDKMKFQGLRQLNQFILKTFSLHWMRVSFRGKGYRLRKFKTFSKVTLNFGHSHWAKLALLPDIFFFKKLRRQNYLCFMKGYDFYKQLKLEMKIFKALNTYTKRGLRLKKQYIKKRFGKISQVVSSLH